jgi:glycosyltransferase involved in cell wall biosynthesis
VKIAQIAPLHEAVPPRLYGGTERVVAYLCDALTELGHDVTLFASAEASTQAQLVPARDRAIRLDPAHPKSDVAAHLVMLYEVRRRSKQFDILHFHVEMLHFPMFEQQAWKTVTTLHGRLDSKDLGELFRLWPRFGLVSISNAQRHALTDANWLGTVAHGLPEGQYRVLDDPSTNYLAFIGRISPEKRPDIAIHLARRSGIPLRIAAKVDRADAAYFDSVIRPLLDEPLVQFIGEIGDELKPAFLGNARALLFPVRWPEPFGLVMIEAMACGTPVIAWNCGSVPEVVDDGVTGFIVNSEDEALAAIAHVARLDRQRVRSTFDRRFTSKIMARHYLDVYARLLEAPLATVGERPQALV